MKIEQDPIFETSPNRWKCFCGLFFICSCNDNLIEDQKRSISGWNWSNGNNFSVDNQRTFYWLIRLFRLKRLLIDAGWSMSVNRIRTEYNETVWNSLVIIDCHRKLRLSTEANRMSLGTKINLHHQDPVFFSLVSYEMDLQSMAEKQNKKRIHRIQEKHPKQFDMDKRTRWSFTELSTD